MAEPFCWTMAADASEKPMRSKRYLAIYGAGTNNMYAFSDEKLTDARALTPQVIGQQIQYFEGSGRMTGNPSMEISGRERLP
jgi:hypothetical protein